MKKKIIIAASFVLTVYICWTVALPLIEGNGVSKFSGAQKEAARSVSMFFDRYSMNSLEQLHVVAVRPVTQDEINATCSEEDLITGDSSQATYYSVDVKRRTLFSPITTSQTYIGCDPGVNPINFFKN